MIRLARTIPLKGGHVESTVFNDTTVHTHYSIRGWVDGVAVGLTRFIRSTKLLYVGPS